MATETDTSEADADFAPADQQEDETDLILLGSTLRFDAAISSTDWTTETVISQLKKGNIFLDPDFQRRDAWTQVRKSQYIESLILGIPTPQIILAERKEQRGSYIVIDGKQRLLSLRQFSAPENDQHFRAFRLKGLQARPDLNNSTYQDINGNLFDKSAPDFENATIRTVVIKSWPNEEFLYEVFLRINSGSVQLSPQELRQALHPGPFTSALNSYVIDSKALRDLLGLRQPDFRMRDNELVLRYLAFRNFVRGYNGNLKEFLDRTTKYFNDDWESQKITFDNQIEDLERSIRTTFSIFGKNAFRKWNGYFFENRLNRAIFDVMTYYFSNTDIAELAENKKSEVVTALKKVSDNWRFSNSVSGTTKSSQSVSYRFNLWADALGETLGIKIDHPIFDAID